MAQLPFKIVDPRLAAGRGEEFSAGKRREDAESLQLDEDFRLPMSQRVEDGLDTDGLQMASVHEAIPDSNRGFQMLQRMGWKGQGLGTKEDGIVAPVGGGAEAGVRLGLGKQEEDDFYTASDNLQRRRLEVEIQADEDETRTAKRELQAEREQRIKQDVSDIKRTFYCEVCHKQYNSAAELEVHLSSYDHHHKKRLVEMRSAEYERTRSSRDRRERRRQEKEMARLNEQILKARGGQATPSSTGEEGGPPPEAPPLPPSPPPPPPPSEPAPPLPPGEPPAEHVPPLPPSADRLSGNVQFGMGGPIKPKNLGRQIAAPQMGVRLGGIQKKQPHKLKAKVAAFALDSDDDKD